jgi:hypothetical protein
VIARFHERRVRAGHGLHMAVDAGVRRHILMRGAGDRLAITVAVSAHQHVGLRPFVRSEMGASRDGVHRGGAIRDWRHCMYRIPSPVFVTLVPSASISDAMLRMMWVSLAGWVTPCLSWRGVAINGVVRSIGDGILAVHAGDDTVAGVATDAACVAERVARGHHLPGIGPRGAL